MPSSGPCFGGHFLPLVHVFAKPQTYRFCEILCLPWRDSARMRRILVKPSKEQQIQSILRSYRDIFKEKTMKLCDFMLTASFRAPLPPLLLRAYENTGQSVGDWAHLPFDETQVGLSIPSVATCAQLWPVFWGSLFAFGARFLQTPNTQIL